MLRDVDPDEVSPVRRAANRRGLVLKEDHMDEPEIADIMAVPWEHEGAMIDTLRKSGDVDEVVLKSAVGAMRLLNGIADDLPEEMRETVEKLGTEMYARSNPPLNTSDASVVPGQNGQLFGGADGDTKNTPGRAGAGDPELDGHGRDGELSGMGAGKKVAADPEMDEDDDAVCKDFEDMIAKRAFTSAQRDEMASNGQAMAGGRYPIANREDLQNAIHAVGRGKGSHAAIRAHIVSRAKALGAASMLPDTWVQKEDPLEDLEAAQGLLTRLAKALRPNRSQDVRPSTPDDPGASDVTAEEPDVTNVNKGGTVETHAVPVRKEDGTWDLSAVPSDSRPFYESVLKEAEDRAVRLEKAETDLAETREALRTSEIIAKAETEFSKVGAKDDVVAVLKSASEKLDDESYQALVTLLAGANEQITKGDLFAEMGRTHGSEAPKGDAWDKIEKAADDLVEKSDQGISRAQAVSRVLETREGAELYSNYMSENFGGLA